ncbi:threonine/serine exporter family protein [Algoriphagus sp. AK58]|uniref:threonine/serine exporter family protein n=1 Tax=Algoriphagus sp. AK58 TaxID=1406877 RepID=UPI00164F6A09|nr:threonine/serine exporter family protein [Algoriphagus sp. AK58]MBC6367002.1 hypothetical protein [Algoriphagus sp. AK58]
MELLEVIFKGFACSVAAFGFAILFNAPRQSLWMVLLVGFLGGVVKFGLMLPAIGGRIVLSTFVAGLAIGFMGVFLGNWKKLIPMMITIPSVIPLVPGAFAYKAMLGLMALAQTPDDKYGEIVNRTLYNGTMTLFVLLAITLGVTIPLVLFKLEFVGKFKVGSAWKKG